MGPSLQYIFMMQMQRERERQRQMQLLREKIASQLGQFSRGSPQHAIQNQMVNGEIDPSMSNRFETGLPMLFQFMNKQNNRNNIVREPAWQDWIDEAKKDL